MERRNFLKAGISASGLLITNNSFGLENIVGNVKNILDNKNIEGANVKLYDHPSGEMIGEYITDSSGNYTSTITGIKPTLWGDVKRLFTDNPSMKRRVEEITKRTLSSNIIKAEITHLDYHNAVRYFNSGVGDFDAAIANKSFDMEFFDAWARGGKKSLRRWNINPKWYINPANADQTQINLVKEIINVDLTEFTDGFINGIIEETSTERNETGSIYIYWTESGDYYDNHNEVIENNEIKQISTWFSKSNRLRRVYLRQLTQCMGLLNNGVSGKDFWTDDGHYTTQGLEIGKFLYNSKSGNISPDTEPTPV